MTDCQCSCHTSSGSFVSCTVGPVQPGGQLSCTVTHDSTDAARRCLFPGCRNGGDGETASLITDEPPAEVFCHHCRAHYRRLLDWLVYDYAGLKSGMPSPARRPDSGGTSYQSPKSKSFGHPAEWASDTAALIAAMFNETEDALREHLQHGQAPRPHKLEQARVQHGWRYLSDHHDDLCRLDAAVDVAAEFRDLHAKVRRSLGQTRWVQQLPTPCAWCDVAALVRDVGQIECRSCGKVIDEQHYAWLTRFVIDQMIDDYDRQSVR